MSPENLQKSIILTGPPCVGKSLIATHLGEKLNMPVFNIDDMLLMLVEERDNQISPSRSAQRAFLQDLRLQILKDPEFKELLINPKYVGVEEKLFQNLVDIYNNMRAQFGDLKCFYKAIDKHISTLRLDKPTADYLIASLAEVSNMMIEVILSKLDQPIIIDVPGCYGWQFVKHLSPNTKMLLPGNLNMRPTQTEKQMNNIIASMQSVLLLPGSDIDTRMPKNGAVGADKIIHSHLDDFIDTDIVIPANELFYPSSTDYLRQRKLADAREYLEKEKLKNKAEITNICEQIISGLNDLKSYKTL